MCGHECIPVPFPLGWFLELETHEGFVLRPDIVYRGVARMYFGADPGEVERHRRGGPRADWARAYEQFWAAHADTVALAEYALAERFCLDFRRVGEMVEPVYAEVVWVPSAEEAGLEGEEGVAVLRSGLLLTQAKVPHPVRPPADTIRRLGYDVANPVPTCSSVATGTDLSKRAPELLKALNASGLFEDVQHAREWALQANRWDWREGPMCVVEVCESPEWVARKAQAR